MGEDFMKKTILAMTVLAALSAVASAQWVTGFESPYVPGSLTGQDGWLAGSGGTAAPNGGVTNSFARTGLQSAQYSFVNGVGTNTIFSNGKVAAFTPTAAAPVQLTYSFYMDPVTGANVNRAWWGMLGTGVNASNVYAGVSFGQDGNIRFGLSYSEMYGSTAAAWLSQNRLADMSGRWLDVSIIANGANVTATVSGLGTSTGAATVTATRARTGAITHVVMSSDWLVVSANSTGTAYFDDMSIAAVPEPATMLALGAGVAALLRRRRKA